MMRYGENRIVVLTGFGHESDRWETVVSHPRYNGGHLIMVEAYEGSEDLHHAAEEGHNRWIQKLNSEKLPRYIERIEYVYKNIHPKLQKSYNRGPRVFEIGEAVKVSPCENLVEELEHVSRFLESPLEYMEFNDEEKAFIERHEIKFSFNHQGFMGMICQDHLIFKCPVMGILFVENFSEDITCDRKEIASALQNIVLRSKKFISKVMTWGDEEFRKSIYKGMNVGSNKDDDDDEDECCDDDDCCA